LKPDGHIVGARRSKLKERRRISSRPEVDQDVSQAILGAVVRYTQFLEKIILIYVQTSIKASKSNIYQIERVRWIFNITWYAESLHTSV
jgi:hypothetical protein